MSIEFVVFVVAVGLLIAYRNLGSGAISSAGGNVASGMKTALGWLAGTGKAVAGTKVIILLVWALFLAAVWYFDPASWKELVIGHWKMFVFLNMLAIGLLFFATQWGLGATLVTFAIIGGIILMMSEPEKPKGVAQVAMKPQEALPEEIVTPPFTVDGNGNWSVVNVPAGYTFTYTCSGWGLVKVYGNNIKPKECGPRNSRPEDWFGDDLRTEEGPDRKQRLRVAFTSTSKGPITAQVTMTKNH